MNATIYFFLTLLGGPFGIHKFATKKYGMGLLYLFTGGLFCIGWIIDIFKAIKFVPPENRKKIYMITGITLLICFSILILFNLFIYPFPTESELFNSEKTQPILNTLLNTEAETPSAVVDLENVNTESSTFNNDLGTRNENLNGHGNSDIGRQEPEYVGIIGYAVVYNDYNLKNTDACLEGNWMITTYEQDKQFWNENGTIKHKTEILVKEQILEHTGYGFYSGYLLVEQIDTKETYYINVDNFITKPYWTYKNLKDAASVGDYIAEYKQVSDYWPVDKNNNKVELEDGINVMVIGKTGTYSKNGPDSKTNQLEAIVFKEWTYGYGGVSIFFNADDLSIVY